MFLLQRPSFELLTAFIERSRELPLSYAPIGLAKHAAAGFSLDLARGEIGRGEEDYARATTALTEWRHFDLGWIEVFPPRARVVEGAVVAVVVRHFGFWSIHGCRVLYTIHEEQPKQFGFAYGTLANHAESGEEIFKVALEEASATVFYEIRAVSRPRAALARLGYPIARHLQARFRRDSMAAMHSVRGGHDIQATGGSDPWQPSR